MSGSRRKGGQGKKAKAKSRPSSRADGRPTGGSAPGETEGSNLDSALWAELRQGARNVAGVRYQLAVSAHLLAESRAGSLPFVDLVPEGLEDIDCLDAQSGRWLIQVKELGAGAGRFTAASVADVISHAALGAGDTGRIVAVTDAQLGRQIVETGWDRPISETAGFDANSTSAALERLGHSATEAAELIDRSYVIRLDWNTAPLTNSAIASCFDLPEAVAAVVTCHLIEDLAKVSADQRQTTADRPGRRAPGDLDALVQRVLTVVDVVSLDSAVRSGVCSMADYSAVPSTSRRDFLVGVDAAPSHIGAGFDVIRPVPTRAVQGALEASRYCLIAGPSGSGKSGQMWRSARDVAPGCRVLRVLRLETDKDVLELVRHVRLLGPSEHSPVIVCGDDLGRPRTARWPIAALRLLEEPDVLLIGGVRQEDFGPELLRHGGELVSMSLDRESASAIADQLSLSGLDLVLEVPEAIRLADGQLMEFIALLTSGRRLQAVLADQADALLSLNDPTGADVARLVCAAHVLGVPLDASELQSALPCGQSQLTRALTRLQDEHLITVEQGTMWRGLHQRRSDVLTALLHRTPPPTLTTTMATVLDRVAPDALGWALRRVVELMPEIPAQPGAVRRSSIAAQSASQLASLLEGLERADHSVTASSYIPVLKQYRRPGVDLGVWATLVCNNKLAGLSFDVDAGGAFGRMARQIELCAADLPDRSTAYCDAAAAVGADEIADLAVAGSIEDAVRLLEAAGLYVQLSHQSLDRIATAFPWPGGVIDGPERRLLGRLIAACSLASESSDGFVASFGSVETRLSRAAQSSPNVLSSSTDDGVAAVLTLLADPSKSEAAPRLTWDLTGGPRYDSATPNDNAFQLATFIGECCPDLDAPHDRRSRTWVEAARPQRSTPAVPRTSERRDTGSDHAARCRQLLDRARPSTCPHRSEGARARARSAPAVR